MAVNSKSCLPAWLPPLSLEPFKRNWRNLMILVQEYFSPRFSDIDIAKLVEKKIRVLSSHRGMETSQLQATFTLFIQHVYKAFKAQNEETIREAIVKIHGSFNDDSKKKLVEFITQATSSTFIELLYNPVLPVEEPPQTWAEAVKNAFFLPRQPVKKTSPDLELLQSVLAFFMPESEVVQEPPTLATKVVSESSFILNTVKQGLNRWFNVQNPIDDRPKVTERLKDVFANDPDILEIIKNEKNAPFIASYTLDFNIKGLIDAFNGDHDKCKKYLIKVFEKLLKSRIDQYIGTLEPATIDKIAEFIKLGIFNSKPELGGNDEIEDLLNRVIPIALPKILDFLPLLFNPQNPIMDEAMNLASSHLDALNHARLWKEHEKKFSKLSDAVDFSSENLERLKDKIKRKITLSPVETVVVEKVWGPKFAELVHEQLDLDQASFIKNYPNYTQELYFKEHGSCHPWLKSDNAVSDHLGKEVADVVDQFLSDVFLKKIFIEVSKTPKLSKLLPFNKVETLFPFFRFIARVAVHHVIKSQGKAGTDLFDQLNKILAPEFFKETVLGNVLLPAVYDSACASLVESVVRNNTQYIIRADLSQRNIVENILLKKCQEVSSDPKLAAYLKNSLDEIYKLMAKDPTVEGDLEADTIGKRTQSLEVYFKTKQGPNIPVYGDLIEKVLFDFADYPKWLRGPFKYFSSFITQYMTSLLDPYRTNHIQLTKVINDKFVSLLGTQAQVSQLVNVGKVDTPAFETLSLDESINKVSKLIFDQMIYNADQSSMPILQRWIVTLIVGKDGSRLKKTLSDSIENLFGVSTNTNLSLALKVIQLVLSKMKATPLEPDVLIPHAPIPQPEAAKRTIKDLERLEDQ